MAKVTIVHNFFKRRSGNVVKLKIKKPGSAEVNFKNNFYFLLNEITSLGNTSNAAIRQICKDFKIHDFLIY